MEEANAFVAVYDLLNMNSESVIMKRNEEEKLHKEEIEKIESG